MHPDHTPEQQRLRAELRAYFRRTGPGPRLAPGTPTRPHRNGSTATPSAGLGADGWLGVGWPEEYGGRGMTAMEQFIFFDEAAQAGVPLPLMALNTVGPTIMRYGTEEQKAYFLPRILSGEIDFAIGYSEPRRRHRPRRADDPRRARRR
ncbi:acyl-CoA dehydrogenase family protein [Streptomyces tricolor]|nr:acyl-CoA dehydrogenase family protein [Streptomyces tricolor]